ncbi:hypothetical protein RJ639_045233 [Escallonia herrerae]|uniref:Cytochrome c assembly protein domain-containing protein n=1 Tax=Escallonia herrerae TaxID=1293975 RepID=A0AA89AZN3_9ASTE|nr:hypothetical protein RJ639_045233 [Escallonia herrerae]
MKEAMFCEILLFSANNYYRSQLIQQLDYWSYRVISLGFIFLTIGILSRTVWANEAWGSYWNWDPMAEDMVSLDPIEFHSEEEPYKDHIDSYQRKTGLTEAVQTGIGQLNGRLSAWLVKRGLIPRSLGFDYHGIETLQIKTEDWHSIAVILYVYGYNYLPSQCTYDVAPGGC